MGRSGYSEDIDEWALIRWRGAVASAVRGKRGRAFLQEMLDALDALPQKRLITDDLVSDDGSEVCALGSVGLKRGIQMADMDPYDYEALAKTFGIPKALVCEIEFMNDDRCGTPEQRFDMVRRWVVGLLAGERP